MTATQKSRTFRIRYSCMDRGLVAYRRTMYVRSKTAQHALDEACRIFEVLGLDLRVQITSVA